MWGNVWRQNFDPLLHPEIEIRVTGSPWHGYLSVSSDTNTSEWDVLFISGSQVTTHSKEWARLYEELVENLISSCENNNWSLAIKLHPAESSRWYRERDWEHYIVEFGSMRDALRSVDVAVTYFSSAFVKSLTLGTPIILSEEWSYGLTGIRPIEGAIFVDNDEIHTEVGRLRNSDRGSKDATENNRLLKLGGSVDRIVNIVLESSLRHII